MSETRADAAVRESRLYRDVHLDHRDAMYRAMTFIARRGGPSLPGDSKQALIAHRERARDWLLAEEEPSDLVAGYEHFLERWSPVFRD